MATWLPHPSFHRGPLRGAGKSMPHPHGSPNSWGPPWRCRPQPGEAARVGHPEGQPSRDFPVKSFHVTHCEWILLAAKGNPIMGYDMSSFRATSNRRRPTGNDQHRSTSINHLCGFCRRPIANYGLLSPWHLQSNTYEHSKSMSQPSIFAG